MIKHIIQEDKQLQYQIDNLIILMQEFLKFYIDQL